MTMSYYDEVAEVFAIHAEHLNSINTAATAPMIEYVAMCHGLVWSDEGTAETDWEALRALKYIVAYRSSLMRNEPGEEYKAIWDLGLSLFPNWVGFFPERRQATPELLRIFRRGDARVRACLRKLDRSQDDDV